jgi:hypothetical protein
MNLGGLVIVILVLYIVCNLCIVIWNFKENEYD